MKVGRNDPCPCGSGKKYKKCCADKVHNLITETEKIKYIQKDDFIHEDIPLIQPDFELSNTVINSFVLKEVSSYRMIYSNLLRPELEVIAAKEVSKFITRGKEEAKAIKRAETVDELISFMEKRVDSLNYPLLIQKMNEHKTESAEKLLLRIHQPQTDNFFELALKILHSTGIDISDSIIEIMLEHKLSAYQLSTLCVVLGFYKKNPRVKNILFSFYKFLLEKFPEEDYWEGPIYGLSEYTCED